MRTGLVPLADVGSGPALRNALFSGSIVRVGAGLASDTIVEHVMSTLDEAFAPHPPRLAERHLDNDAWLERVDWARSRLDTGELQALLRSWFATMGLAVERLQVDRPRLRAVKSGGHHIPQAAPAYFAHRDTWYGNPRAQLNAWLALHDVHESESFSLFPDAFGRSVRNDSATFALAEFEAAGGFQSIGGEGTRRYPRALEPAEWGESLGLTLRRGEGVLFSAAHLHATRPHDAGLTRFSLDVRCVDPQDVAGGSGAPDPDNESAGDTFAGAT